MVLLNLESEQCYGLNAVGADIVTRLTSERPMGLLPGHRHQARLGEGTRAVAD